MKIWKLLFAVVFFVGSASAQEHQHQHAAPDNAQLEEKNQAWAESLARVARTENAAFFFDVNLSQSPPYTKYSEPRGQAAMKTLAMATKRVWREVNGVQTFSRMTDGIPSLSDDLEQVITWIKGLDAARRTALLDGSLLMSQIDLPVRDALIRVAGFQDANIYFALLDEGDKVNLRLHFVPTVEFFNENLGKVSTYDLVAAPIFGKAEDEPVAHVSLPPAVEPLNKPEAGPLDFGQGALLSLRDVISKASNTFGVRYVFDGRIAENRYFVSGKFTRQSFEAVLQQVTTIAPVQAKMLPVPRSFENVRTAAGSQLFQDLRKNELKNLAADTIDVTWARERLANQITKAANGGDYAGFKRELDALKVKFGPTELLNTRDFLDGRKYTVAQFSEGKPGLAAHLAEWGLKPDSTVTLGAGLGFKIRTTEVHELRRGTQPNGQQFSEAASDQVFIGLL